MAKFFKKILCPVDFDDNSIAALDYACQLAAENEAKLYVLHAVFVGVDFPLEPYGPVSQEPARKKLDEVARDHLHGRVQYEILVRGGKPADIVIKVADELDVDLVVMTTHGRKALTHLLLGSVAEKVVRESTRPVLTLRPSAGL
jgi:universal stress protein A